MPESIPRGPFDQGLFLTHYNKGEELFKEGRLEDAETQLEEAYLLRPRDVRVLNLLGLIYYRQEKLAKAEEVYRKLIAESPDAYTLYMNLGLICLKLDRLPDAESAFLKALDLSPEKNPKVSYYLGSIYERTRRFKDAIYQYRQAGANLMVQRVEGKMGTKPPTAPDAHGTKPVIIPGPAPEPGRPDASPGTGRPDTQPPRTRAIPREVLDPHPEDEAPEPTPGDEAAMAPPKPVEPVSPKLMSPGPEPAKLNETARFQVFDDTLPPGRRVAPPSPPRSPEATDPGLPDAPEPFRCVEKGLMEVDFSGKVFIKQGTIYSLQRQPHVLGQGEARGGAHRPRHRDRHRPTAPHRQGP